MLKLTKKADYGLIALRHLATAGVVGSANQSSSAKDIAECYHIPLPLLSKVLQTLVRTGLLVSEQGTHGGYRLSRPAQEITALEVIRAIDGPIILTNCFTEHGECTQSEMCTVREPLRKVHEGIMRLLSSISIYDMLADDMPIPALSNSTLHNVALQPARIGTEQR